MTGQAWQNWSTGLHPVLCPAFPHCTGGQDVYVKDSVVWEREEKVRFLPPTLKRKLEIKSTDTPSL